MAEDRAVQLSQIVEREVRQLIGELQMQILVLRAALNMQQEQQPIPPQPEQSDPEESKEREPRTKPNGNSHAGPR